MTWWSPNFDASPLSSPDAGSDNESDQTLRSALPSPGGCFTPALCKYKPFQRLPQARGVRYHVSIYWYFKMCVEQNRDNSYNSSLDTPYESAFCSRHCVSALESLQLALECSPQFWPGWCQYIGCPHPRGLTLAMGDICPRASLTSVQNISTRTQNIWLLIIIHYVASFGRHVPLGWKVFVLQMICQH